MNLNSSFSLMKWMLTVQGLYSVHPTLILRSAAFSWTEEMCVNPNGVTVGPKGRLLHIETNKTIVGTTFERKRGDSCPCSYVSNYFTNLHPCLQSCYIFTILIKYFILNK